MSVGQEPGGARRPWLALGRNVRSRIASSEWDENRRGSGFHLRERFDCRVERLVERPCSIGLVPYGARIRRGEQNTIRIETEIHRLQALYASNEQPTHNEQHHGARNLRGGQALAD